MLLQPSLALCIIEITHVNQLDFCWIYKITITKQFTFPGYSLSVSGQNNIQGARLSLEYLKLELDNSPPGVLKAYKSFSLNAGCFFIYFHLA